MASKKGAAGDGRHREEFPRLAGNGRARVVDQKRPIIAVHGVGAGTDEDRAGFSLELSRRAADA